MSVVKRRPPRIVPDVRPPDIASNPPGFAQERVYVAVDVSMASAQRAHAERILRVCGGCVSEAARLLGISRSTLTRWQRRWARADALRPAEAATKSQPLIILDDPHDVAPADLERARAWAREVEQSEPDGVRHVERSPEVAP